jgi:hypothetical protein
MDFYFRQKELNLQHIFNITSKKNKLFQSINSD